MKVSGNTLVGRALKQQGVDTIFFLMGGPMLDAMMRAIAEGIRPIDVRHEQGRRDDGPGPMRGCAASRAYARQHPVPARSISRRASPTR